MQQIHDLGSSIIEVAYTWEHDEQAGQTSYMEDRHCHLPLVCTGYSSPSAITPPQHVDGLSSAGRCVSLWDSGRFGFAAASVSRRRGVLFPIARPTFPIPTPPSRFFLSRPANPCVFATFKGPRPAVFQHLLRSSRRGGEAIGLWYGIYSRLLCLQCAGDHCLLPRFLRTSSSLETQTTSRKA
jgi:hypothetical protein